MWGMERIIDTIGYGLGYGLGCLAVIGLIGLIVAIATAIWDRLTLPQYRPSMRHRDAERAERRSRQRHPANWLPNDPRNPA